MKILSLDGKLKTLDKKSVECQGMVELVLRGGVKIMRVIRDAGETEHYSGRATIEYNGVRYLALGHRGSIKKYKDGYILFVVEPSRTRAPTLD